MAFTKSLAVALVLVRPPLPAHVGGSTGLVTSLLVHETDAVTFEASTDAPMPTRSIAGDEWAVSRLEA